MSAPVARVPAALHVELTEHASLVRALRTASTLDLTAHLLRAAEREGGGERESDAWTQWPLTDCPVPEWSLDDEIRQLGETVQRHHAQAPRSRDDDGDSDSDLDGMSPTAANVLVRHTGSVLVCILNLMADQRPSAPGSMQTRLWPMSWEDVISLLAVSGVVHPTVVARAERRLERIYGPPSTKAMHRLQSATAAKTRFSKLVSVHEDHLFAPPILHSRARRGDAKANRAGPRRSFHGPTKTPAIIDTDTDMDA